jgi:uncharacterized metal-binding protein
MTKQTKQKEEVLVNCAKCTQRVCDTRESAKGPDNCPSKIRTEVIAEATERCISPENVTFAYNASKQEASCYITLPHAPKVVSPSKSRVEEIMEFAERMRYKRLGVAYCVGVQYEASLLIPILENRGFEVVSVCCKCGSVPKEELGFEDWEKIIPGAFEAMCHPMAQAEILNSYNTELNIMVCLCVGHDSLFLKNSRAPCTVLAAKDRVFGHAPLLALYLSRSYHRRVLAGHTEPDAYKEAERARATKTSAHVVSRRRGRSHDTI